MHCRVIGAVFYFWPSGNGDDDADSVLVYKVERLDFEAFATEPGNVTSASNVEVRCKVRSRGSAGTAILKIVDEGQPVQEGDFLVQFDDSLLQNEKLAQQIIVANDKAALTQAESDLEQPRRRWKNSKASAKRRASFNRSAKSSKARNSSRSKISAAARWPAIRASGCGLAD